MYILAEFLGQTRTNAAEKVENQESFASPLHFHYAAEHPYGKHIEKDMTEAVMQEHIGNQLPYPETWSHEEMESEQFMKVYSVFCQSHCRHPAQDVDDEQILGYWG